MNPSPPQDDVIRITRDDAMDTHVDDMLKRQLSLRGQPGVSREHGRKWYYQNWFVLMLVGMLGAFAAWAILEPVFDDYVYFQGPITNIDTDDAFEFGPDLQAALAEVGLPAHGAITVRDEKIHLLLGMRELTEDGEPRRFDPTTLQPGEPLGVYLTYISGVEQDLAFASFVVRNPPPENETPQGVTVHRLSSRSDAAAFTLFALVAGFIGLFIGAADGIVCRLPRRALLCGGIGLLVGLVGGLIASLLAGIAYIPLNALAMKQMNAGGMLSTLGFTMQVFGRAFAWGMAGTAMGLGQGIALRSTRLLLYGLIGGIVGGLLGGLFFDPIDLILVGDRPSSHWSRLIGFLVIGASAGGMIGMVELMARDAWLRMTQGPLTGKEFLIFKDIMSIGSSPRSDIYLFNDPMVAENHATLRALGDMCEIEARHPQQPVLINGRSVTRARLRHGDSVGIGRTAFVFQQRKTG